MKLTNVENTLIELENKKGEFTFVDICALKFIQSHTLSGVCWIQSKYDREEIPIKEHRDLIERLNEMSNRAYLTIVRQESIKLEDI